MARQKEWCYIVAGRGRFPIDQLRYDGAIPASSRDAREIERSFEERDRGERLIRLRSVFHGPTVARWESYGWRVLADHGGPVEGTVSGTGS